MNVLTNVFQYQANNLRTFSKNGEPWFVVKDVCDVLEIKNSRDAFSRLEVDEKDVTLIDTPGGQQVMNVVNEFGLYNLILSSRKPEAKQFKRWITHEVIPSIRKHGGYIATNEDDTDEDILAKAVLVAQKTIEKKNHIIAGLETKTAVLEQQIAEYEPKLNYLDTILNSKDTVTISQIAEDYGKSASSMNKLLHQHGIQYKINGQWLLYSKHKGLGYTKSKPIDIKHTDGSYSVKLNTRWTQKGRLFIYETLKKHDVLPLMDIQLNKQVDLVGTN
jgi:anti-repressor protein